MGGPIDDDDLEMLREGFTGVMASSADPAVAVTALHELGWVDLLNESPAQAMAMAFTALGATGSAASLIDDIVTLALGADPSPTTCVVLPPPHSSRPPGMVIGDSVVIQGLVSGRFAQATRVLVAVVDDDRVQVADMDVSEFTVIDSTGVDPSGGFRRVSARLPVDGIERTTADWDVAIANARIALAHQLIGASRWMLEAARQHAIDRVQFGRPIASFQAVRHRLAECLVDIEGAQAVADAWTPDADRLLATLAKASAGKAARTNAKHAQQVLAGIGFTTDHPFHLWLRRSLVLDVLVGSATSLPAEIGAELLRRRTAPRLVDL